MSSHGARRVTSKVWRGILEMWGNPSIIEAMQSEDCLAAAEQQNIQQKQIECVIRAVDWAQAMKDKHK